jgi:hypothetical protein
MSRIFVIAGTVQEARRWANENFQKRAGSGERDSSMNDYVLVSSVMDFRGIQDPHGVFVGNWLGRPDIYEIVQAMMVASIHVNPALSKVYSDLKPKIRPTPKLKPISVIVDEAAEMLAKEIDAEVLRQLTRKINGGAI